jgi:2-(1,2-epoxy-1,2-dihydrophenyl)acetyl-CoA isomerase
VVEEVLTDVADGIATITLNRPDRANAVTTEQAGALLATLQAQVDNPAVRVVILTGSGGFFNVGAYRPVGAARVQVTPGQATTRYREQIPVMQRVIGILHGSRLVTIAAVNGACAGAGFALALATDLRYAAESARFNTAFLSAGYPGELGAIWFANRLIGMSRTRELFLLPGKSTAQDLAGIGLINAVYPGAELNTRVREVAARIAAADPVAVQAMKANFGRAETEPLPAYLSAETEAMITCLTEESPS